MRGRRLMAALAVAGAAAAIAPSALTAPGDTVVYGDVGNQDVSADGRFVVVTRGVAAIVVRDLQTGGEEIVSRASGDAGEQANGPVFNPSISTDGRFVAFQSSATNLGPDATTGQNVYVRDRVTDQTILASRASGADGAAGDDSSFDADISADGRHVAFTTSADNLVTGEAEDKDNVVVRDLLAQTTALVSRASGPAGAASENPSSLPSISGDGRFIAFRSSGTGLADQDTTDDDDIFVRDMRTAVTTLASLPSGNGFPPVTDNGVDRPEISADGRHVAFLTADAFAPEDTNGQSDAYVRDLIAESTTLASAGDGLAGAAGGSFAAAISADGRRVAFSSTGALTATDTDGNSQDIFVRDVPAGVTTLATAAGGGIDGGAGPEITADGRFVIGGNLAGDVSFRRDVFGPPPDATEGLDLVSRASGGRAGLEDSTESTTSADGRYTAFVSGANNLSTEDDNDVVNAFVRDNLLGITTLVSRADGPTGAGANADAANPAISPDGRFVAFDSEAGNLSGADTGVRDVFVRDLDRHRTILVSRRTGSGPGGNDDSSNASLGTGGRFVAYQSAAQNLSDDDGQQTTDIFVLDRGADLTGHTTVLASRADGAAGVVGDGESFAPSLSADGTRVAFTSTADSLSSSDRSVQDIFVRDLATNDTTLVSRATGAGGAAADAVSFSGVISAGGGHVAFTSNADNLSGEDRNDLTNLFVRDLGAGTTTLANRAGGAAGAAADASAAAPSISGDGRRVAFSSVARNLSDADPDATSDVFVRDLADGATILASRAPGAAGAAGDDSSAGAAISADGRWVTFTSAAKNLSGEDFDDPTDIFRRDVGVPPAIVPPVVPPVTPPAPTQPAGGAPAAGGGAPAAAGGGVTPPATRGTGTAAPARRAVCAGRRATIVGTNGRDLIRGTAKADVIAALGGVDDVRGLGGNDVICLGGGNDRAVGGAGNDRILGQGGDDRIEGQAGRDVLLGGAGIDTLLGGAGKDTATGGPRADVCVAETAKGC